MATLLFTAVGTAIGGPLGGLAGALIGRQVDSAIFGNGKVEGPRLKELDVTTSSYGTPIPRHYGRMRVAGSMIWSTDLKEQSQTDGGKNQPDVTIYTYSVSFAVAIASRRILDVGRIWADGKLLRGAAGDLKTGGTVRVYRGTADQPPDPLIAEIEGADRCPAYRGLAYLVFEDLDLADFYNRIPALTFEVIADDSFDLQDVVGEIVPDADAAVALDGITGFSCEGPLAETLGQLDPIFPLDADAGGETLLISPERLQPDVLPLSASAVTVEDDAFGAATGQARRRGTQSRRPPEILRYYDVDRDYQPGAQRAAGRALPGQPLTVELAAAMTATTARALVERTKQRADWSRDRIAWRTTALDPDVGPGTVVTVPGKAGRWRVSEWEWREAGIELGLERVVPTGADEVPVDVIDPGRINPNPDLLPPPTSLVAYELPWDGTGSGDTPAPFAALSSTGSNWSGAALFVDLGNGELQSLGPSGRTRSIIGTSENALSSAIPLLIDRTSTLTVQLIDPDMVLAQATARQLAFGWNRALLGNEIIQFAHAEPLGQGRWLLSGLLRGRGGTENHVPAHAAGEQFVLLDGRPVALDPSRVTSSPETVIVAVGRGDDEPLASPLEMQGITLRPLSPVHPKAIVQADGSLTLAWTRRARGAYLWLDGADTPLHEETESYRVTYGPIASPVAIWTPSEPELVIPAATVGDLGNALAQGSFHVRQQGSYDLSEPLHLFDLP